MKNCYFYRKRREKLIIGVDFLLYALLEFFTFVGIAVFQLEIEKTSIVLKVSEMLHNKTNMTNKIRLAEA